jgi:hypothetical protein
MKKLTIDFAETDEEPKKRCSKCERWKALDAFGKGRGQCKACLRPKRKYLDQNDRFWKSIQARTVRTTNGCLEWTGSFNKIPIKQHNGKTTSLRRLIYQRTRGDVPDDMVVLMTCKNKLCINSLHMKLGTTEDREALKCNSVPIGDANGARLHPERHPRGERVGTARLTENEVRTIRHRYALGEASYRQLASEYSVSKATVADIITRRYWAHVSDDEVAA